ncbi:MAG: hypothetical protein RMM58_14635 [Chloroflexota bacterium]|nr:hypothetical protein [Dehalococcoidia bacterium]MDW8255110.1 hypothetical protein [Chloroflexota bacterium]
MIALELALDLAADLAVTLTVPARDGVAMVAARTVEIALDLADQLRAGHVGRARESLIGLENRVALLRRLAVISEGDAARLFARCAEIGRLVGGRQAFSPLPVDHQTDCSPALIDEDDE